MRNGAKVRITLSKIPFLTLRNNQLLSTPLLREACAYKKWHQNRAGVVQFRREGAEPSRKGPREEIPGVFSGWASAADDRHFLLKSSPEDVSLIFRETLT